MKWATPAFIAILQELYPQYRETKGTERDEVIKEARRQIKELATISGEAVPSQLTEVISSNCTFVRTEFLIDV
jgi:hypothetical protein